MTRLPLDAISVDRVFLPILIPVMAIYQWDPVWFGIIMAINLAIGQFTPPMAANLKVATRIAVTMESTTHWEIWMVLSMALALVTAFPQLALWLPQTLEY